MNNIKTQLLSELKTLIKNEIESNKTIEARIIEKNDCLIKARTTKNIFLNKNMQIEVNRIPSTILNISKKNITIKMNKKANLKINQMVSIKNIQKEIIIQKLQETYDTIYENNLDEKNKETLNVITEKIDVRYNNTNHKISKKLNDNQQEAVKKSLQANKFHIIKGPPGTGKTHTIIEIIKHLHKENKRILITTHTHIALDNILERLDAIPENDIIRIGKDEKISSENRKYSLNEQVKKHPSYELIVERMEEINKIEKGYYSENDEPPKDENNLIKFLKQIIPIRKNEINYNNLDNNHVTIHNIDKINEINEEIENIKENIQYDILRNVNIIASTIISSNSFITKDMEFDYVIMDEASQVPVYLALIPLLKTDKFILIGDDKQLQPITNKNASYFLNKSIFNLLINKYPEYYTFLNIQYRMNQDLSNIASKLYYNKKLLTGENAKNQKIYLKNNKSFLLNEDKITLIDTSNCSYNETNVNGGCRNRFESEIILNIIRHLKLNGIPEEEIGVITPYRKQKKYIESLFHNKLYNIECDTIYRFQGREKDVIIISFCKSSDKSLSVYQKKFLADKNQLNVSITRSRKKLIIICNSSMLTGADNIKELIQEISLENTIYLQDFIKI